MILTNNSTETENLIDVTDYTHLSIDAEWKNDAYEKHHQIANYLTVQLGFSKSDGKVGLVVVFWNSRYEKPTIKEVDGVNVILVDSHNLDLANLLTNFKLPKKMEIFMYYSPKDMQGILGRDEWRNMLLQTITEGAGSKKKTKKFVNKMRRLNVDKFKVNDCEFTVKDLIGIFNTSLENALASVGVDDPFKELATKDGRSKALMEFFILQNPNEFLQYAVGDVLYLHTALIERVKQVNKIIKDALGIPNLYTSDNIKLSTGALVADVFEKWLIHNYPELIRSTMLLSTSNNNKDYGKIHAIRDRLVSKTPTFKSLDKENRKIKGLPTSVHGLSACGIRAFYPGNYGTGTTCFGAVVHGGRCVNERPENNRITNVLDIDISGCYGNALKDYDYPLGLPTIYGKDIDDKEVVTLGSFLKEQGEQLIDGLYTIYLRGDLSFYQDLVHSKYGVTTRKIASQLFTGDSGDFDHETDTHWDREIEHAHIKGDFVLTTKQLEFGIVTSDVLEVIKAVSSNKEWQEWQSLIVDCAVYYPKNKEVTHDRYCEILNNEKTRGGRYSKEDTRTKNWTRISLEGFIGNFLKIRKDYKNQRDKHQKGTKEYGYNDLMQNAVKLFVNTTYGCLAAPYFPMGNTVLANNITAKARTGVWMVAKALNTVQSITDGGMYSIDYVHSLKTSNKSFKKPGFDTLYLKSGRAWTRNVEQVKLHDTSIIEEIITSVVSGDLEKQNYYQNLIDGKATEHIRDFWGVYGLVLPFDLEHKVSNTGLVAAYMNSGDYAIHNGQSERIYKVRGAKEYNHPKKLKLNWIIGIIDTYLHVLDTIELIGVQEYQENYESFGDLMPGDGKKRRIVDKPKKDAGFLYTTYKEWLKASKSHSKKVLRYNKTNQMTLDLDNLDLDTIPRFDN